MAVNGATLIGRESEDRRPTSLLPTSVSSSALSNAYCSLPSSAYNGNSLYTVNRDPQDYAAVRHHRPLHVPAYVGSSSSSPTSSLSSEDAMNMRFTDLTHMHLKKSIDQIHGNYNSTDSDHSDRQPSGRSTGRQASSSSNGTYGSNGTFASGSGGLSSARDGLISSRVGSEVAAHRQQLSALVSQSYGSSDYSQQVNKSPGSSSKFHSLLSVKDALLEEKESTIVKLRLQVSSLQHQVKDSTATLRQVIQGQQTSVTKSLSSMTINGQSQNGDLAHHEAEYEAAKMRVRLAENLSQQERNVNDLQNLLGKTECQLADAKSQHAREKRVMEDKVKELEFCLRTRDKAISEGKKKQKALLERIEKYKRRVESLERYLGDLPTMEESRDMKKSMDIVANEKKRLAAEVAHLKDKVQSLNALLKEKEEFLDGEAEKNSNLESEIQELSKKITDFERVQEELGVTERKEFEETMNDLQRLQREREDAAKLLAAADTRMKTLASQHRTELEKAQERLEQEENVTQTLRRELSAKQQTSAKVQSAMSKLVSQNQQLMEEKLSFLEQLRALESERTVSREAARINARLQRETQIAARDLEAVAQVLVQSSRGDDPNLSALLGVRASAVGLTDDEGEDFDTEGNATVETATRKLADVRKLRRDIDELRSTLSNRYAENIGQNCATQ